MQYPATDCSVTDRLGRAEDVTLRRKRFKVHEIAIAQALLKWVLKTARENRLTEISEVRLRVGELRLIVPEALNLGWRAVTRTTVAGGSTLRIREVQALVCCRQCDKQFRPAWPAFTCPDCGQADVQIVAGNELILEQVVGKTAKQNLRCSK